MTRVFTITSSACFTLAFLWNGGPTVLRASTILTIDDQATNVPFSGRTTHLLEGGAGVFKAAVRASFDGAPFTPWAASGAVLKPTDGSPKDATAIVLGPDVAEGRSVVTWNGTFSSVLFYDFEGVVRASAVAATPTAAMPVRTTLAQAKYIDPVPVQIGPAGSAIPLSYSLNAGAQLPAATAGQGPLDLTIQGRFGLGTFADSEQFWPLDDTVPNATFNLFSVHISENSTGGVGASVQLFSSPDPRFSVTFDHTASEITAAILGAGWMRGAEGNLQISSNLSLINATITTLSSSLMGSGAAVGTEMEAEAFDRRAITEIPESPSLTLLLIGSIFTCLGWRVHRRSTFN
jgi:hypothetical protein